MHVREAMFFIFGRRLVAAVALSTLSVFGIPKSVRAADSMTSGFVEITGEQDSNYAKMLRNVTADTITTMGIIYVPPEAYEGFDKTPYANHLQIIIEVLPQATRILVSMLHSGSGSRLFDYPIWLFFEPTDQPQKKLLKHLEVLRKELAGPVHRLYQLNKDNSGKPKILADCIFPATEAQIDLDFSSFLTTSYPSTLRANETFAKFNIIGISPDVFAEWCRSPTPLTVLRSFEIKISGRIFKFQEGSSVVLAFEPKGSERVIKTLRLPSDLLTAPNVVEAAVTGMISEREK
jgi:hypothetical protein